MNGLFRSPPNQISNQKEAVNDKLQRRPCSCRDDVQALAEFKDRVEEALLDTHSFQALRLGLRPIHQDMASYVQSLATMFAAVDAEQQANKDNEQNVG